MEHFSSRKRPLSHAADDEEENPAQKRARFPKSKKDDEEDRVVVVYQADNAQDTPDFPNPRTAATERAQKRRLADDNTKIVNHEECVGMLSDITAAEVDYDDNEAEFVVIDGVKMVPFNLNKERQVGFIDEHDNFVAYVDDEAKDAWLDSLDNVDIAKVGQVRPTMPTNLFSDEITELSAEEIGKMKKRIADVLEPKETVLLALKRLKWTSTSNMKEKMPEEIKLVFDQLTEDAMLLMMDGYYNVYRDKRELFEGNEGKSGALGGDSDDIFAEDEGNPYLNMQEQLENFDEQEKV